MTKKNTLQHDGRLRKYFYGERIMPNFVGQQLIDQQVNIKKYAKFCWTATQLIDQQVNIQDVVMNEP